MRGNGNEWRVYAGPAFLNYPLPLLRAYLEETGLTIRVEQVCRVGLDECPKNRFCYCSFYLVLEVAVHECIVGVFVLVKLLIFNNVPGQQNSFFWAYLEWLLDQSWSQFCLVYILFLPFLELLSFSIYDRVLLTTFRSAFLLWGWGPIF